jgi:pyruvate dehydrogenase E2 component (dihydrolipoamide acetyltransferase)
LATNIVMPQMGYDMREGTVVRWHKKEGEAVARGEALADIETDKAIVEYPAFISGVLGKIMAEAGVVVPVGELIAVITAPGEDVPDNLTQAEAEPTLAPVNTAPQVAPTQGSAVATKSDEVRASPIARRLARERGINLGDITGTGPGGRIVEKDVLEYTPPDAAVAVSDSLASPNPQSHLVELSRMRQTIARVTSDSKREAPHFYVTAEVDMTGAMDLRRDINEAVAGDTRVTVNDLIVKAAALALVKYPKFNASFQGESLRMNASINIGIAIALEAGLMVPGIGNCEAKKLTEIAAASKDLIERANSGHLSNEEYSETTFSVSNLGMYDVESFSAIIYPPHAAVLAVGTVKEQAVVRNGELAVAQMMKATLSTDHRVADGAEAARFLVEIKEILENPVALLL